MASVNTYIVLYNYYVKEVNGMNKKFSREEMYLIYEELKRRYKEI